MGENIEIRTTGDRALGGRLYLRGAPLASIVIHGATAVSQQFYEPFALTMAELGFAVLTYDYRGVGKSVDRPLIRDPATMAEWIEDAESAQRWLDALLPEAPLFAIGHSFGGQVAGSLQGVRPADAIALVGAGSGFYRNFPPSERGRLWLSWRVGVPALTHALGRLPGWAGLGEDLPAGVARQWARWCLRPNYMLSEFPEIGERIAGYDGRVLALSFDDDDFAPRANVQWLNERFASATLEHRTLTPSKVGLPSVGHFGLFRRQARHALWPMVAAFFQDAVVRGRGADRGSHLLSEIMSDLDYGR